MRKHLIRQMRHKLEQDFQEFIRGFEMGAVADLGDDRHLRRGQLRLHSAGETAEFIVERACRDEAGQRHVHQVVPERGQAPSANGEHGGRKLLGVIATPTFTQRLQNFDRYVVLTLNNRQGLPSHEEFINRLLRHALGQILVVHQTVESATRICNAGRGAHGDQRAPFRGVARDSVEGDPPPHGVAEEDRRLIRLRDDATARGLHRIEEILQRQALRVTHESVAVAGQVERPPIERVTGATGEPDKVLGVAGETVKRQKRRPPRRIPSLKAGCSLKRSGHVRSVLLNGSFDDVLLVDGLVAGVAAGVFDFGDDVHAGGHLAKNGVLHVEPGAGHGGDEELRTVGAGASVGHGEEAGLVELDAGVALVLKLAAPEGFAAHASAGRVAALQHEFLDHAVENNAVVVALVDEADEVFNGLGSDVGHQLNFNGSLVRFEDCGRHIVCGICEGCGLFSSLKI